MADMDPPLADLHPLRALYLIPVNKPPTFAHPKKWSKGFRELMKKMLTKDPAKRPGARELLNDPMMRAVSNPANKRPKHVLIEYIDKFSAQLAEMQLAEPTPAPAAVPTVVPVKIPNKFDVAAASKGAAAPVPQSSGYMTVKLSTVTPLPTAAPVASQADRRKTTRRVPSASPAVANELVMTPGSAPAESGADAEAARRQKPPGRINPTASTAGQGMIHPLAAAGGRKAASAQDSLPLQVKALNLAKNFPFDILCCTTWGAHYLIGTPVGLYRLDSSGVVLRLIEGVRFNKLTVLEDYGVLVTICGRHNHIRMYKLALLENENQISNARFSRRKLYEKVKNTRGCNFFSIVRTNGTVFMLASVRRTVILFMWADFPFDKFMKIKDFYVPENALRAEPVMNATGTITSVCVMCQSCFVFVKLDTHTPTDVDLAFVRRSPPLTLSPIADGEVLLSYQKVGAYVQVDPPHEATSPAFNWRFTPSTVGTRLFFVFRGHCD